MNRSVRLGIAGVILSSAVLGCSNPSPSTSNERGEFKKPSLVGGKDSFQGTVTLTECGFTGVEQAISAARGKVVLIDCWATWCGPCVASFPQLVEKHKKFASKGLAVISVSLDRPQDHDKALAFLQQQNATFTNLQLKQDEATHLGLQHKFDYMGGIPHAVLFSKIGQRVWAGHPLDPDLHIYLETELTK